MSLTVSLADSSPVMRGLASAVSHTCTSGVHVHPQWRAYDDSFTTMACASGPLTGQPLLCCHGTIAQLMASLTYVRDGHVGLALDCIGDLTPCRIPVSLPAFGFPLSTYLSTASRFLSLPPHDPHDYVERSPSTAPAPYSATHLGPSSSSATFLALIADPVISLAFLFSDVTSLPSVPIISSMTLKNSLRHASPLSEQPP